MSRYVTQLPASQAHTWVDTLSPISKMRLYDSLWSSDSVQFPNPHFDSTYVDDSKYLPLDTFGIHFIDMDFDGDLDLVYSGISGPMNQQGTRIYLNQNTKLIHHKDIAGYLMTITHLPDSLKTTLRTCWQPCCDSYTSRIESFEFSNESRAKFTGSISIIGRLMETIIIQDSIYIPSPIRRPPDFSSSQKAVLTKVELIAFQADFRGTSPYFRDRNQEIRQKLRLGEPIPLLTIDQTVPALILTSEMKQGETYYLVLTDALNDVPKSLYEWSEGNNRQFIGWVHESLVVLN